MNKIDNNIFFIEIKDLIEQSRLQVATTVNTTLISLYWNVGHSISSFILSNKRAEYGKETIKTLSDNLTNEFGKGWSDKQLRHCIRFAETFSDFTIVSILWRQFSWSHFKILMYIEDEVKRDFYIEIGKIENWSSRILQEKLSSMLFERTSISRKPEKLIQKELKDLQNQKNVSPDLFFRDPYFLEFLNLKDTYSEKDFENAILAELQRFISELGNDFAFLERQKRIIIDNKDYYIDLLFYHRRLKSLIVIDLKIGEFDAAYKGEMELYLGYLNKYEKLNDENEPIGLILCTGKNPEHIELLQLNKTNIRVADYFTILPSKEILFDRLKKAIEIARNQINK